MICIPNRNCIPKSIHAINKCYHTIWTKQFMWSQPKGNAKGQSSSSRRFFFSFYSTYFCISILSVYISILIQLKYKELADLDGKGLLLHSTVQLFIMYVAQLLTFSAISFSMNHIQNHETHQMTMFDFFCFSFILDIRKTRTVYFYSYSNLEIWRKSGYIIQKFPLFLFSNFFFFGYIMVLINDFSFLIFIFFSFLLEQKLKLMRSQPLQAKVLLSLTSRTTTRGLKKTISLDCFFFWQLFILEQLFLYKF